jgi:hypothetical protein
VFVQVDSVGVKLLPIAAVGAVVVVAGGAAAWSVSSSTASQDSRGALVAAGCPRSPATDAGLTPHDFATASNAVRAQVPRVFKNLSSQGHPAWHHAGISALISVYGTGYAPGGFPPRLKRTAYYERTATRACGTAAARASLVAFLNFPECQLACAYGFAYVTKTRRGWYVRTPRS